MTSPSENQTTKSAVFALFGKPNAGKSTLLNALLGEKIAPVHRRPQMTRKNLLGILTEKNTQLLFIDTPGFHASEAALNQELHKELERAVADADNVLVLLDVMDSLDPAFAAQIKTAIAGKPALFLLNKTDVPQAKWKTTPEAVTDSFPGAPWLPLSALTGTGLAELKTRLMAMATEGPYFYPEDDLTTATMREIAANILLEKIMEFLGQELPYEMAVVIEAYKERPDQDEIQAVIVVNRDSQKGMVIGKGGQMLKKIGSAARYELEAFLQKKVNLKTFVKVDRNWVKNSRKIREYHGFER